MKIFPIAASGATSASERPEGRSSRPGHRCPADRRGGRRRQARRRRVTGARPAAIGGGGARGPSVDAAEGGSSGGWRCGFSLEISWESGVDFAKLQTSLS